MAKGYGERANQHRSLYQDRRPVDHRMSSSWAVAQFALGLFKAEGGRENYRYGNFCAMRVLVARVAAKLSEMQARSKVVMS